jgi:hypothetical protein
MDFNKYYKIYLPIVLPNSKADEMLKEIAVSLTSKEYEIRPATEDDYKTFAKREKCNLFFILYNESDVLQPQ